MTAAQLERAVAAIDREAAAIERVQRVDFGKQLGGKGRGTLAWRMHPDYTQRLGEAELRRFDWTKAQAMRGVALTLWMGFTSPRMPYRPMFDAPRDLELVEIPLTVEHCHALGVRSATVTDDDERTVVRLRHRGDRSETFRSLVDVEDAHEQLALL